MPLKGSSSSPLTSFPKDISLKYVKLEYPPWTLNPTITLAKLMFNNSGLIGPLSILFSILKLLPWASQDMQQAIFEKFPTLNLSSPYFEDPQTSFFFEKFSFFQFDSKVKKFKPEFSWGTSYELEVGEFRNTTLPYALLNQFSKIFLPRRSTSECAFYNPIRQDWGKYWVLHDHISLYKHPQEFQYIPIPLLQKYTMYVIPSMKTLPLDPLFNLHDLPHVKVEELPRLALPKLNYFSNTYTNLSTLLNMDPIMSSMFNESEPITTLNLAMGIQFSSDFGIHIHCDTQFNDNDILTYQPETLPPLTEKKCPYIRFQLDTPFYLLFMHSITQAVLFLGYIEN
ncbi:hypothetical protein HMI56_003236 [Coelomomyces lativittatus]|nr:hypothetical protein HMI56_003236 [Coelomomyces lativittatus]